MAVDRNKLKRIPSFQFLELAVARIIPGVIQQSAYTSNLDYLPLPMSADADCSIFMSVCIDCAYPVIGWILIQQHYNGSASFHRGWNDYKNGFGNVRGDYWIGNDWLHLLTSSSGRYKVRFDLQAKTNSQWYWAEYSTFSVANESTNYTLTVTGYSGTAGDSLNYHNGKGFVTLDRNNPNGCATGAYGSTGAFWHGSCGQTSINGSPLLYSSSSVHRGFGWFGLPFGSDWPDRQLLTSRMWLVPL